MNKKDFTVIFSKDFKFDFGEWIFTKIQSKTTCDLLGLQSQVSYYFWGKKRHAEGALLNLDPDDYIVDVHEDVEIKGVDELIDLKHIKALK